MNICQAYKNQLCGGQDHLGYERGALGEASGLHIAAVEYSSQASLSAMDNGRLQIEK